MNTTSRLFRACVPWAFLLYASACFGQIVGQECCTTEVDLQQIGYCISGPGAIDRPEGCESTLACVVAFGPDESLSPALCRQPLTEFSFAERRLCVGWSLGDVEPSMQCLAKQAEEVDLFSLFDDEGDGDLDMLDVALFQNYYPLVPNAVQPNAVVASTECCLAQEGVRRIGDCFSGPGVHDHPLACDTPAACVIGLSEPVQVGDYAYQLCTAGDPDLPGAQESICVSWHDDQTPVKFECLGAQSNGITTFNVFDADGDADLDLHDYMSLQNELGTKK